MVTEGSYTIDGIMQTCSDVNPCLIQEDIARGHFQYITSWYWASMQTILPDGRRFAANFGDGIARELNDRKYSASEDCLWVDGKHFKLDTTRLVYDQNDFMAPKRLYTISEDKRFNSRNCTLDFTPVYDLY